MGRLVGDAALPSDLGPEVLIGVAFGAFSSASPADNSSAGSSRGQPKPLSGSCKMPRQADRSDDASVHDRFTTSTHPSSTTRPVAARLVAAKSVELLARVGRTKFCGDLIPSSRRGTVGVCAAV